MRSPALGVTAFVLTLAAGAVAASEPSLPRPEGFVTDRAGVISAPARARLTRLLEELQRKTGAEVAVVTVDSTAPLDDFTYAMRLAEAWKPGRKGEDTGVVFLVAVRDRRVRVLVGYGLEGILPDGLIGEIEDREVLPAFRAGRYDEGIMRGVSALARRIAADRSVTLEEAPRPRPVSRPRGEPVAEGVLFVVLLAFLIVILYLAQRPRGRRFLPAGGWGSGGFGGGWSGGGGGFGGFGGGSFGGGGAGRSW